MARVKAEESRVTTDDFSNQAKEYAFLKKQIDFFDKQMKSLREKILEHIDANGEVDSKGHLFLEFDAPIEGFVSIQKTRRVKRVVDEEAARSIIEAKGLQDSLYKTIQVIDEDALMAALYTDELTEEEIDEMYPEQVSWALNLNKK